jgi:hypothetical protein
MGKKLYVGNLSFSIDDSALQAKFSEFGAVDSAKVITDRATGRSKGFGFVEMANDGEADAAIEKLTSTYLKHVHKLPVKVVAVVVASAVDAEVAAEAVVVSVVVDAAVAAATVTKSQRLTNMC